MRKIKLLLSFLTLFMGGNYVSAQETPENNGVYYLYNQSSGLFLTRGNNWGTQAVARPVGLPWKVALNDGKYTLRMYDLTVAGITSGFGSNAYTDNGSPIDFTPAGNATDGFTLQNGSNYITCPATAGDITLSSTSSAWQFLTQAQYDDILAAKASDQESAVAAAKGIVIPDGKTLSEVVSDANNWASTTTNDGVPTKEKWTATNHTSRKEQYINWGNYGSEMYQVCNGHYTRTISGLKKGIYKISARGMKRMGSNAVCTTMANAGYPVSDTYLIANGNIIRFKAWAEDRVSDSNPNSTGEFVNIVNNGGYTTEGFVYVGDDGNLNLDASSEAYWGTCWFLFNGISYTFYNDEVSDDDATTILTTANSIKDSKMGSAIKSTLTSAISTFDANKTIANFNALNDAINAANTSIASYLALATAIANANNNTIYKPAFTASATLYTDAVSAAQSVYDNAEVDDCAATINTLTNAIYGVYENDYSVFANNYKYDYSTLLNQDMTKWASTDYVTMTANEHWNGLTGQRYYEQSGAEWGKNSWSHAASETAILPAGKYVMSITARASVDVTSTMSVKVGNNDAITVSLTNKGADGRGIMTNGTGSYQDGTYAKGGVGYGWEYRFISFEVTENNTPVTISFSSSTNASHNWVSIASPLLKGDVHPNQIKLNQINSLLTTLTGYENKISSETYATFADHISAANAATVESTNLDAIITNLQADIAIATEEFAAFERGAAMNDLIAGANSVVLSDEATAANWKPTPTYNDWSTEADNTGMVTPFLQNWIAKGNTLADNSLAYHSIRGIQDGFYEVSALVRIYSESGEEPSATSAVFTVNGTSVDLLDGTSFVFNNMKGVYKNVSVKLQIKDALNIGIAYSDAGFNWISWKNLKVTYLGTKVADNEDYTALNNAITTAEAKVLGFEKDEFAPYNNIDALAALAAAQAINPAETNIKESVNAVTDELNNAVWTANAEEVNAIAFGDLSTYETVDGKDYPYGWSKLNDGSRIMGGSEGTENAGLSASSTKKAMLLKYNASYGETTGYTLPLKAGKIYKLTFKYCGWGNQPTTNIILTDPNGNPIALAPGFCPATNNGHSDAANWYDYTGYFTSTTAGDYVLTLKKVESGQQQIAWADMELKSASEIVFADGDVPTYAPGNYPAVKIARNLATNKWATAVYPFAVSGVDKIAVLDNYAASTGQLSFVSASNSTANVPFLMRSNADVSEIALTDVYVEAINNNPSATANEVHFIGSYTKKDITNAEKNYVLSDNTIYPVGENAATINPYRAYFQVDQAAEARALTLFIDGEVTGISELVKMSNEQQGQVYDLQGRKVEKTAKGLYIKNGKKVVVK
ncbi:hypothetical protein L6475_14455 [Prevotella sp. E9-3]|uniref:hypothetical protein n=1 Tax=Prevotella sp. E9-3 TaxID=2913621 RepID=UPI001EDA1AC6|nr:hypothetical protein [Prevotella sp. E9-3]UKK48379.1 hypothetical protein L6475_14455 [Prevotella sp. E9-3]